MQHSTLLDEDFPSRVEATFPDARSARSAAMSLCMRFSLDSSQISYFDLQSAGPERHTNRFAYNASGWSLQKRQVKRTIMAFMLIIIGIVTAHVLYTTGVLSRAVVGVFMSILILAAVALTVMGMLAWRPPKVSARTRPRGGDEVVLVVKAHDVSEQYELRRALKEMGADTEPGNIAEVA